MLLVSIIGKLFPFSFKFSQLVKTILHTRQALKQNGAILQEHMLSQSAQGMMGE